MTVRRQPRARTGAGGTAPSMKGKDPRASRIQPTVGEDTVRARAIQRLQSLPSSATSAQILATLNDVIAALQNKEKT